MFQIQIGHVLRQYIVVIVAYFSFLHIGISSSWMSPVLVKLRSPNQTVLPEPITEDQGAWILSISFLIALTAIFYIGYLPDTIGRKYSIILACLPKLVMCMLFIFAKNIWMMLLGRALSGISDMFIISATSTYTSEIASKDIRGGLGTISQILSASGAMVMLSVGPFLPYTTLIVINLSVNIVTLIPMLFLPESPYFLYSQGKTEEAINVLAKLRNPEFMKEEIIEYSQNVKEKVNKKQLLKDPTILKSIGKAAVLGIGSQMTGFNAMQFYLQTIFESTNTNVRPEISSVVIGCIQLISCLCTLVLTDRFGRKPILTTSLVGLAIGMIGLGTFFELKEHNYKIIGALNYLPLISMMLVIYCYNAGIGSLVWTLMAELFDGPSRAFGVSTGVFMATLFIFLTTRYFPGVTNSLGPSSTYWIFSACCILTCFFIVYCVPETKGKAFSEIQRELGRKDNGLIQENVKSLEVL